MRLHKTECHCIVSFLCSLSLSLLNWLFNLTLKLCSRHSLSLCVCNGSALSVVHRIIFLSFCIVLVTRHVNANTMNNVKKFFLFRLLLNSNVRSRRMYSIYRKSTASSFITSNITCVPLFPVPSFFHSMALSLHCALESLSHTHTHTLRTTIFKFRLPCFHFASLLFFSFVKCFVCSFSGIDWFLVRTQLHNWLNAIKFYIIYYITVCLL